MVLDSFWRVICLTRYYTTCDAVQLLPPPKRSFSFHCAECQVGIEADQPIFMRAGRSYCSERCRALAPETDTAREKLYEIESAVRRRVWNASPSSSADSI
jgi:hypothetical protein